MITALIIAICAWIACLLGAVLAQDACAWRASATFLVLAWITLYVWSILLAIILSGAA